MKVVYFVVGTVVLHQFSLNIYIASAGSYSNRMMVVLEVFLSYFDCIRDTHNIM